MVESRSISVRLFWCLLACLFLSIACARHYGDLSSLLLKRRFDCFPSPVPTRSSVTLTWDIPPESQAGVSSYDIRYRLTGETQTGEWVVADTGLPPTTRSYTLSLPAGSYEYQILGNTASGQRQSAAGSFTVLPREFPRAFPQRGGLSSFHTTACVHVCVYAYKHARI